MVRRMFFFLIFIIKVQFDIRSITINKGNICNITQQHERSCWDEDIFDKQWCAYYLGSFSLMVFLPGFYLYFHLWNGEFIFLAQENLDKVMSDIDFHHLQFMQYITKGHFHNVIYHKKGHFHSSCNISQKMSFACSPTFLVILHRKT